MTEKTASTQNRLQIVLLITATLLCLVPFLGRAYNIDEPLFIWVAKQIRMHPLDFYGFRINWYNFEMPAAEIIKNPPLASYYLALTGVVAGWSEVPLHAAFLIPAVAAMLGTYLLAGLFTRNALSASLLALLTPVFILSSSTVMCDTMMLAFYVWAVYLWMRGLKSGRGGDLALSALLVAACSLTKYFGVTLIPLLLVYTLASGREQRQKALFLLIPVALLALYQWETSLYYGRGLLSDAAGYASRESGAGTGIIEKIGTGLSFTGGSFLIAALVAARRWSRRSMAAAALAVAALAALLTWTAPPALAPAQSWDYYLQFALFTAGGATVLGVALWELWRSKDPDTLLLVLWAFGTFLFASVINWSVNGRSVLPMTPAIAILVMRFIDRDDGAEGISGAKALALPLCGALVLSMAVAWGDFTLAGTARSAAATIAKEMGSAGRIWFQGHWGFQYYLEEKGGVPYDVTASRIVPGELMAVPENNCNLLQKVYDAGNDFRVFRFPQTGLVSTHNLRLGSGFYSSRMGALPYRFCAPGDEIYHMLSFDHTVTPSSPERR